MGRAAGGVAVLEDVARAVDARPLAVPHGEDAVMLGAGEESDLLRAPDGGRREILVDAGLKADLVPLEEAPGAPEGLVEPAEWRAAIAGDEGGGIEPRRRVALALHHGEAHERLRPGQIDAAGCDRVFVIEGDCGQRHDDPARFTAILGTMAQQLLNRAAASAQSPLSPAVEVARILPPRRLRSGDAQKHSVCRAIFGRHCPASVPSSHPGSCR